MIAKHKICLIKIQQRVIRRKGSRECNRIGIVTYGRVKKAWIIHVNSHSANSSFFDGLCLGQSSLLNTNSPRQPSRAAGMMSSLRLTDGAGGSHPDKLMLCGLR